ncbi:uncharacterized protein LOC117300705 isoform X2 [Asterias rubens]|uniref:uncharacterized protein LOC117300705 isoform X2 n=1 Tax=Asterias rubens TaxID=7604 RepID=UPI0014556582|nr:uncharacterized protein LOC117300705 isoform X2 [Asterias rubens]
MDAESNVLGASGMLRPSPRDDQSLINVSSPEKMTENIDVEATSDIEPEEVAQKSSSIDDVKSTEDDVVVADMESVSSEKGISNQKAPEMPSSGSTSETVPDILLVQTETAKEGLDDDKHTDGSLDQKSSETNDLDSSIQVASKTSSEEHVLDKQMDGSSSVLEESSENKSKKERANQSESSDTTKDAQGTSSSETQKSSKIDSGARSLESRLGTIKTTPVPSSKAKTSIASTSTQSIPNVVPPPEEIFSRRLKSFEDAFKATLQKLEAPKKTVSTGVIDLTDSKKSVVSSHKNLDDSKRKKQKDIKQEPSSKLLFKFDSKPLPEKEEADVINIDLTDDEEDSSKQPELDNFSSDSSSTIIDVEQAAKESTEEEAPVKSAVLTTTSKSNETTSQPELKIDTDVGEAKPESTDPASDTKLSSKDRAPWFPKENKMETSSEPTVSQDNKQVKKGSPQSEQGSIELRRRSRKSIFLESQKAENIEGFKVFEGLTFNQSPKTKDTNRRRYFTDQSDEQTRVEGGSRMRSVPRERSKSDEGRILTGKKYRISKSGVLLQPGNKVEAMDYSKKWYTAKIVNLDEVDKTVLIHFEGWNSRFDEWLGFESDRLRPLARVSARKEVAKEVKALGGYKIGNEVLARWSDCRYYPAKILGIKTNGSYRVLFYDGIEKVVMGINVRDMPDSLKSQDFFSNLEHQFRALLNKKRKSHKEEPEGSLSGSRPSSPVPPAQKRRHPSTTSSTSSTSQPIKRSRPETLKAQPPAATKVPKVTKTAADPVINPPTPPQALVDLPSPTSSETNELIMSALDYRASEKKRYREPLIFDKNSGLIRDPRRLIAPKELVIDLDHNKYKCEVPDCGKGFRKASLLEYHKKYYHINKPATSTSAHTAAKNAVTRSRKRLSTSTIATGASKIRRHESLDSAPAKVSSRQRSSAPGIMTSVYKRPLSSTQDTTTKRLAQSIKSSRIKQKLLAVAKKEEPPIVPIEEPAANPIMLPPSPAPALVSPKRSEVTPKVSERSRRVSGTVKDDKPIVSKDVVKDDIPPPPSAPAPTVENKIKLEPIEPKPSDTPEVIPEVKPEVKVEPEVKDEVKGQIPDEDIIQALKDAVASGGSKKDKRNKTHKKHKRHKARSRDRRTREQSRSNRRRIAERAKERRLQKQSKGSQELPEQGADSVMEWTSKYIPSKGRPSKGGKNLPRFPAQSVDVPDVSQLVASGGVDSSATEDGGPKEMISCICRNPEEEGFMIQCETCFGWQHGGCVGLTEHTIPKQYICNFCTHPENLRTHARHRYNIDWFQTGKLPCLIKPKEPDEEAGSLTESMHQTHQLMADMLNVTEALDTLQHKIKILKSTNHPDLKLWSYHWGLKDETSNLDESSQSLTLHSSLDDTDLQLTSAENSALTESLRSDVLMDSLMQNDTSLGGLSDVSNSEKPKQADDARTQEGDKPKDVRNIFKSLRSMLSSGQYGQRPGGPVAGPETVNEVLDENRPSGSSGVVKSFGNIVHKVKPLMHTSKSEPTVTKPTGIPTACFVPDAATDINVTSEGGAPVKSEHDGKVNNAPKDAEKGSGDLSDDEPLINYVSKLMPSGVTVKGSSVWTPVKSPVKTPPQQAIKVDTKPSSSNQTASSKPVTLPSSDQTVPSQTDTPPSSGQDVSGEHNTPLSLNQTTAGKSVTLPTGGQIGDGGSVTAPSSDQTASVTACKVHLLHHIVCVEEELKRRMDLVEEQIEAMEVSFAQSTGTKDVKYTPTDPVQMTKTIRVIMNDLDQVSKLVSI